MQPLIIEHIKVKDLPETWRNQINASPETQVTIRIEEELSPTTQAENLFGMWKDRDDMENVESYLHSVREPRWKKES